MATIKIKTIDTSTLCPGRGGAALPILPEGTKVVVAREGMSSIEITTGFSTAHQLCTKKGTGLALHHILVGASRTSPVELTLTWGE